jgi:hypothetical protein
VDCPGARGASAQPPPVDTKPLRQVLLQGVTQHAEQWAMLFFGRRHDLGGENWRHGQIRDAVASHGLFLPQPGLAEQGQYNAASNSHFDIPGGYQGV